MKNMRPARIAALALATAFALSAGQLVTNGDFETGDFTGWTTNPAITDDAWTIGGPDGAYTGQYFAYTGCVGAQCIGSDSLSTTNYLYEDLNTVVNATYTVSFAFASGGTGESFIVPARLPATTQSVATEEEMVAMFGNVTLADLIDVGTTDYAFYSQTVVASSTITRLEFQDREDPGFSALDDISVTQVSSTPEAGTTLLGLVAALLSWVAVRFGAMRFRNTHSGRARTES